MAGDKILIVDDNIGNIEFLNVILEDEGFEISTAYDGPEALEKVSEISPELILLDINMPEMSGYEVCERLKQKPESKDIPIIFLTAQAEFEDIIQGFNIGAVDYVTKPFNSEELLSRVNTHLELYKSKKLINEQIEELHRLNATKDRLLSIIGHDLRSPFVSIVELSKMLSEGIENLKPDDVKEMSQAIYKSSKQSFNLLEGLLEWAKSQSGKVSINIKQNDLAAVVDKAIELISLKADRKGVKISSELEAGASAMFDLNMITTVVRNLLSNAIKYTGREGEVVVSAERANGEIRVVVKDTGMGIREENLSRLFKDDVFITTRGTDGEKGTGLGLSLCKEFVEKNGGTISVESKEGEGSTFMFTIPK